MENHHFIAGKIHYKWPFSIAFCMFTRGYSWGYNIFPYISHIIICPYNFIPWHLQSFPAIYPYSLVKSLLLVGQIAAMFWCYPTSLYQTHIKSLLDAYVCICICICKCICICICKCICIYHYICIIDKSLSRISPYYHPIQPIPIWNNRVSVFVRECQLEAMHHHPGTFMDTGHSHSLVELRCWGLHHWRFGFTWAWRLFMGFLRVIFEGMKVGDSLRVFFWDSSNNWWFQPIQKYCER